MIKLYLAYTEGVYRQKTIAVKESYEDVIPCVIDYFKANDDYHSVVVCELSEQKGEVDLHTFSINSDTVCVNNLSIRGNMWRSTVRHGNRVIIKDGEVFMNFHQEYVLKEGESFVND